MRSSTLRHAFAAAAGCLAAGLLTLAPPRPARAVTWLSGFDLDNPAPSAALNQPTQVAFLPDGRWLVCEKRGVVWALTNGVMPATPLWDGQAEVLDAFDRGLLSIAVDPNYRTNHYLYFLYTVDPDSNNDESNAIAFGRLTRYQVSFTDSTRLVAGSRTILMGTGWSDSPLELSPSHTIGCLRFARDGTLLVSCGDGANFDVADGGGLTPDAFAPGMAPAYEDIGAFRAQNVNSLGGKILRLDPATGHGVASNPFWDGDGTHKRSKVWCYGLRNPFRFTIKPGTGSTNPADGQPGELYIGDVGWSTYDELNVSRTGGENFGWPCKEGRLPNYDYANLPPSQNFWCDSLGTPTNPAPQFTDGALTTHHYDPSLSTPPIVIGNTCLGGAWYTGTLYPASFQNRYFDMDFGQNYVKMATFDSSGNVSALADFASEMVGPVDLETEPVTGDLVYVSIYQSQLHRFRYTAGNTNQPPDAVANGTPTKGLAPLSVSFSSAGTLDPENDPLAYSWDFGDQSGSPLPNPSHTYAIPGEYTATLSVDDGHGNVASASVQIHVATPTSFPTTGILDDFQRPDGPLGGSWSGDVGGVQLAGGRLEPTASPVTLQLTTPVLGPTEEVYADLPAIASGAYFYDLYLKAQDANPDDGVVRVRYDSGAGGFLVTTDAPFQGWVGRSPLIPATLQAGDQIGVRADSLGLLVVYRNHQPIGSADLSGWTFFAGGGMAGLGLTNATGTQLEDFGGGNAVLAANTPPVVHVLNPDTTFFVAGDTLKLNATAHDAQDPDSALIVTWVIDLHHNTHIHPAVLSDSSRSIAYATVNHGDGTPWFLLAKFTATDRGNLSASDTAYAYPEIDLAPESLATQPATPNDATPTQFSFRIRNLGRMPSSYVHWQLLLDGAAIAQGDTLVAALDSVALSATVGPLAQGPHVVHVAVDTLAELVETNEANNDTTATIQVVHGVLGVPGLPRVLALSAARPNPSRGAVDMGLDLPRDADVDVLVSDVQGRVVWSQPPRAYGAGRWTLHWDGNTPGGARAPAGLYLVRVRAGGREFLRRIVLVR